MNIVEYSKLSIGELVTEIDAISRELASLQREHGIVSADRQRQYIQEWVRSPGGSAAAKDREAEFVVRDLTSEMISLKGQIDAAMTIRDLLKVLLEYRIDTEPLVRSSLV